MSTCMKLITRCTSQTHRCTYRLLSLEFENLFFLGTFLYFLEVLTYQELSVGLVQFFLQSNEH